MGTEKVALAIDELGILRSRRKTIEDRESKLTKFLKDEMKAGEKRHGGVYTCELIESTKRVPDVAKVYKKVGRAEFIKHASITITNLKRLLSDAEIDKVTDVKKGSVSVRTTAIPQMQTPAGTVDVEELVEI